MSDAARVRRPLEDQVYASEKALRASEKSFEFCAETRDIRGPISRRALRVALSKALENLNVRMTHLTVSITSARESSFTTSMEALLEESETVRKDLQKEIDRITHELLLTEQYSPPLVAKGV
jgi:hypothetical protein